MYTVSLVTNFRHIFCTIAIQFTVTRNEAQKQDSEEILHFLNFFSPHILLFVHTSLPSESMYSLFFLLLINRSHFFTILNACTVARVLF